MTTKRNILFLVTLNAALGVLAVLLPDLHAVPVLVHRVADAQQPIETPDWLELGIPQPQITTTGAFSFTPTVVYGEPISWSQSGAPGWAAFNTSTGQLTGTATAGASRVFVTATEADGDAFTVVVPINIRSGSVVTVDSSYVASNTVGGVLYLDDGDNKHYQLTVDLTALGTALVVKNNGVVVDLNGHTITHDNATPISIANHSFETVDAGNSSLASGWDFAGAPNATRFAGDWATWQVYGQDGGDYSLRFTNTNTNQEVVSTSQVTLLANTTYSLSAMFAYGPPNTSNPGSSCYVTLDGTTDRTLTQTGGNTRGMQLKEYVFTTGGTDETYDVKVGVTGHASSSVPWYVDSIKIQRTGQMGVAVGPTVSPPNAFTPDLGVGGSATNCVVRNGTITQGADDGTWCHGVFTYTRDGLVVDDVNITVGGPNSSCVAGEQVTTEYAAVLNSTLTSSVDTITSRDNYNGGMLYSLLGTVADNTFTGGPHLGIGGASSTTRGYLIARNSFAMQTRYTNGFAILISDKTGVSSKIFDNTVDASGELNAGPGIMVQGVGPTDVWGNDVYAKLLPNNQEYGGYQSGGPFALELENAQNKRIWNNTFLADCEDSGGKSLRFNAEPTAVINNEIRDNVFTTTGVGPNTNEAICFSADGLAGQSMTNDIIENTFNCSQIFIGQGKRMEDCLLNGNTLNFTGSSENFYLAESAFYTGAPSNWHIVDLELRDMTYGTGGARSLVEASGVRRYSENTSDAGSNLAITWTTTIQVNDASAIPVAGASVVIVDGTAAEVFTGTTDGNGQCVAVLTQQTAVGTTITSKNNHTVTATSGLLTDELTFTADHKQTITLSVE